MRIIDKNHDFYDYMQAPDDTIVFDRRNSFLLTKEMVCNKLNYTSDDKYRILLLQCGARFWLILLTITKTERNTVFEKPIDYTLELLDHWTDYNKLRQVISLEEISLRGHVFSYDIFFSKTDPYDIIKKNTNRIRLAVEYNEHKVLTNFNTFTVSTSHKSGWTEKTYDIPLLNACGIKDIISPDSIFTAIEEHFSMEKSEAETTEAKGTTNDDKIIMHGFDTKISFRGKRT